MVTLEGQVPKTSAMYDFSKTVLGCHQMIFKFPLVLTLELV